MEASGLKELGESIHDAMVAFALKSGEWSEDLTGGCAVGAWLLHKAAKEKLKMKVDFQCTPNHAWNEFEGHIFDITATQYGVLDKVFMVPKDNLEKVVGNSYHRSVYQQQKRSSIWHVNKVWPYQQRPKNYKIQWLDRYRAKIVFKERSQ